MENFSVFFKWVKDCVMVSPYVTFVMFMVVMLLVLGFVRNVYLYWYEVYKAFMTLMVGKSWFTDDPSVTTKETDTTNRSFDPSGEPKVVSNVKIVEDSKVVDITGGVSTSVDSGIKDNKSGSDAPKEAVGLPKVENKNDLKSTIKEAVKEALEELVSEYGIKGIKKKKPVGETAAPKKKSKKSLEGEVSGTDPAKVTVPKKKKTPKKGELVITKDPVGS
uniref:M-specific morf protein n=1 Tax=Utterbackia peninsularis TaxID=872316 RepID=F4ZG80_9BIVA|nr:M-specific morf protein [Utterbackia peninsularis]ADL62595.1 M-specific morf protein [Utterbackia peninsularis]